MKTYQKKKKNNPKESTRSASSTKRVSTCTLASGGTIASALSRRVGGLHLQHFILNSITLAVSQRGEGRDGVLKVRSSIARTRARGRPRQHHITNSTAIALLRRGEGFHQQHYITDIITVAGGGEGGGTTFMHSRGLNIIDPRIPTTPERQDGTHLAFTDQADIACTKAL